MVTKNPYQAYNQAYKEQSVMTMTPAEMLTALYDGVLKQIYVVKKAFARDPQDLAEINLGLQKAQKIVSYLKTSLDTNYDVANNLYSLYDYCNWILVQANIKKDDKGLDEVEEIMKQLKDSYIQADKSIRMQAPESERTLHVSPFQTDLV